jgi:hypothetical protein
MIPFTLVPKKYRYAAILVGGTLAALTIYKLYQDIQLNKDKLEENDQ